MKTEKCISSQKKSLKKIRVSFLLIRRERRYWIKPGSISRYSENCKINIMKLICITKRLEIYMRSKESSTPSYRSIKLIISC